MYGLLLLVGPLVASPSLGPGDHRRELTVDGRQRFYLIHVPAVYDAETPTPVVLAFHGGGGNARVMQSFSGLNDKADEAGFLAVYPNGTSGLVAAMATWNGGECCGYAQRKRVDDVAFVRALLDDLQKVANVDPRRIYATGMSNGAIMSYRLASELSDRIAAIAPVGASMGTEECSPTRPVSVLHIHGTDDRIAPMAGGVGSVSKTNFLSVDHAIDRWTAANECPKRPTTVDLPDRTPDGMRATRTTYGPGKDGTEVVLIKVHGGGHTWPGRTRNFRFLGPVTSDFSANDVIWEFFERHPMPEAYIPQPPD